MKQLTAIGLAAAMALSASPASAQGAGAAGGTGTGPGARNLGTTGMGTRGITHPPGSTIRGNLTLNRGSTATTGYSTSPNNDPSMETGSSGTSNLPGNNSTRSTRPH
ncbi:hypothetical protein JQ615_29145 [Bradyrhizobium jicamae]|uniref:Uncharacterized protein n=1 Tax=Bradyrhizobium jicamae TaxID=280332 RepID=A0ABS5FRP0_9BRAD|nr:hypothetical protein [Bradyrhizobium jicamae]MBR0799448.1 hypothetical protein [Bradyrhizobium jicamae]